MEEAIHRRAGWPLSWEIFVLHGEDDRVVAVWANGVMTRGGWKTFFFLMVMVLCVSR